MIVNKRSITNRKYKERQLVLYPELNKEEWKIPVQVQTQQGQSMFMIVKEYIWKIVDGRVQPLEKEKEEKHESIIEEDKEEDNSN